MAAKILQVQGTGTSVRGSKQVLIEEKAAVKGKGREPEPESVPPGVRAIATRAAALSADPAREEMRACRASVDRPVGRDPAAGVSRERDVAVAEAVAGDRAACACSARV